jgi:hypothetical protein
MPGSDGIGLLPLAERRLLRLPNGQSLRTPLLVPSFSSRVPEIEKIFRASAEFLDKPFLISAYDIAKGNIHPPFDFGAPVFLDSGGYETGPDADLSDVANEPAGSPEDWNLEQHREVIDAWDKRIATVVVTYDHPNVRLAFGEQIRAARAMAVARPNFGLELLLKPETRDQKFLNIDSLADRVRDLSQIDAIGVTEKEVGNSVFERMLNIAKIRMALRRADQNMPIHVFGSLDSITTLFYFVAGADIFDGLTWLRYAFKEGHTLYRQDFGIGEFGIATKSPKVEALCWVKNYHYMKEMELEMRRFLNAHNFSIFRFHADTLRAAYGSVEEEVAR